MKQLIIVTGIVFSCILYLFPDSLFGAAQIRYVGAQQQGSGLTIQTGGTTPSTANRRLPATRATPMVPQNNTPQRVTNYQAPEMGTGDITLNMQSIMKAYVDKSIRETLAKLAGRCPAGQFVVGFNPDGSKMCEAPQSSIPTSAVTSLVGECSEGQTIIGYNFNGTIQCSNSSQGSGQNSGTNTSGSNGSPLDDFGLENDEFLFDGKIYVVTSTTSSETWDNAVEYCNNLSAKGYTDWKLPNMSELMEVYDRRFFISGFTDSDYWSSTVNNQNRAWYKTFNFGGQSGYVAKNITKKVRCVKSM